MAKVVVDPVTRIEGHLGVTLETKDITTKTGTWTLVDKAYCHTNLFRGFEIILKGRDPRDAYFITPRICGVCHAVHGEASMQALDHAYGVTPPPAAVLIRNIMFAAFYCYDHMIHTYLLVGPELGILANYPPMVPPVLGKEGVAKLGLGSSYVACVEMQRIANEVVALWGGKAPFPVCEYPGGVTVKPTLDRIAGTIARMSKVWHFAAKTMYNDIFTLREESAHIGEVVSSLLDINFRGLEDLGPSYKYKLSYGLFPDPENYDDWVKCQDGEKCRRKSAVIHAGAWDGDFKDFELGKIKEYVKYSKYDDACTGLPPNKGKTIPKKDKPGAYAWAKAPRYDDKPYEVGPFARMVNTFGLDWKFDATNPVTGESVKFDWKVMNPNGSVIDRVAARVAQTILFATKAMEWAVELKQYLNDKIVDSKTNNFTYVPSSAEGFGLVEAPRGALLHYTNIKNKKIANYQCIVPSTWNLGPRDDMGQPGAVEKALENTWLPKLTVQEVANALYEGWGDTLAGALTKLNPLYAKLNMEGEYNTTLSLAVIRSFDPCIACAVHMIIKGR